MSKRTHLCTEVIGSDWIVTRPKGSRNRGGLSKQLDRAAMTIIIGG